MVNYAVTDVVTAIGTVEQVAALLETAIEAVDNAKTIRLVTIVPQGHLFKGVLIHDA